MSDFDLDDIKPPSMWLIGAIAAAALVLAAAAGAGLDHYFFLAPR